MNEYQKRVLEARKQVIALTLEQQREIKKIYEDLSKDLIPKILDMKECRTKQHQIEIYKIVNQYRTDLHYKINESITKNIGKSADIQKGVQLSFVDMISPNSVTNEALKRTITEVSSNTVKQLIAGNYYKDGKTLSKRIWNLTGDNAEKIDKIIKTNIAKGANVKELAKELDKYVNPKARTQSTSYKSGVNDGKISYQAERLARTSITHAQTEVQIQNAKKNPFCKGLKWCLSASHGTRMHGRSDICDDYSGKVFKPEDLPLQHPNCLCYFIEVIEDFDKIRETMKDWGNDKEESKQSKSSQSSKIDEWVQSKKHPNIETKSNYKDGTINIKVRENVKNVSDKKVNKGYNSTKLVIRNNSPINDNIKYEPKESNVDWNEKLGINKKNSDKLNEIHTELNKFIIDTNTEKINILDLNSSSIIKELTSGFEEIVNPDKEMRQILKKSDENSLILSHNHVGKTPFSDDDISFIIRYRSIKALTLECSDGGKKFIIERGNLESGYLKYMNFDNVYPKIYNKFVKEKYPEVNDPVKVYEVWDDFLNDVNEEIAKYYGMNYLEVKND